MSRRNATTIFYVLIPDGMVTEVSNNKESWNKRASGKGLTGKMDFKAGSY